MDRSRPKKICWEWKNNSKKSLRQSDHPLFNLINDLDNNELIKAHHDCPGYTELADLIDEARELRDSDFDFMERQLEASKNRFLESL